MKYVSTRGGGAPKNFEEVVSEGLAPDGGLYVPETFTPFTREELEAMKPLSYQELAVRVMKDFVAPSLSPGELAGLVQDSYSTFTAPDVAPMREIYEGLYLLELFHGPTLAFKDIALQFLGRVFGHFAHKREHKLTVLGATSGDTGSAAIAGCLGIKDVQVFILYPHKRPSEIQRRQMTTLSAPNVHALAVQGSFDDCQLMVKRAFQDEALKKHTQLTAVNSINWARILAQSVYYFYAGLKAGVLETPVNFIVPTGNFGNIYSAYVAKRMGLPVGKLIAATNRNDSVTRFIQTGVLQPGQVVPSMSPSMDIQVASNLERYVFELLGRDGAQVTEALAAVKKTAGWRLPAERLAAMQSDFSALRADERDTAETMASTWKMSGILLDPHTAVGMSAVKTFYGAIPGPMISLACAHPAKFPETVRHATRQTPPSPKSLANIDKKKERFTVLPNNYDGLRSFILSHT